MGDNEWEAARVVNGRPAPGAELAPGYNPWEAGLQHLVSMSKGHFIGRVGSRLCFSPTGCLSFFPQQPFATTAVPTYGHEFSKHLAYDCVCSILMDIRSHHKL